MQNNKKIILDLCGGTGAWGKPYKDAGYDVRLITLPDHDVQTYKPPKDIYGILAAPPCTMFSLARTNAPTPRDFKGAMEIVSACLNIIWKCHPKFWALENPRGYLPQFLGKPAYRFEGWWFGDAQIKSTYLWGYFNDPKTTQVKVTFDIRKKAKEASRKFTNKTKKQRAITPSGFAEAFFLANQ